MRERAATAVLVIGLVAAATVLALWLRGQAVKGTSFNPSFNVALADPAPGANPQTIVASQAAESILAQGAITMGIDPATTGNSANMLGTVEGCYAVTCPSAECTWDGSSTFDGTSDYIVDVVVYGDTQAPIGHDTSLNYDPSIVHIAAPGTDDDIKYPPATCVGGGGFPDALPDSVSPYNSNWGCLTSGTGTAGDGTITRIGLDIGASGVVTFSLNAAPLISYTSEAGSHPVVLHTGMLAINQDCPPVTPTPSGTPTPTPTPSGMPTPTPTATPSTGPETQDLVSGWNNVYYMGPPQPIEDALTDISDKIQAVYRLRPGQAFERWFPNRPELSTITTVNSYEPLFILTGDSVAWIQQPFGVPPTSAQLVWGWNNVCYAGQTKDAGTATQSISGKFAVIYSLGPDQSWKRFVPGRPDISNLAQLDQFSCVLTLVTAEGGARWVFEP